VLLAKTTIARERISQHNKRCTHRRAPLPPPLFALLRAQSGSNQRKIFWQ
jgi:hypothetical protein